MGIPVLGYPGLARLPNSMPGGVFQCDKCYPDCPPPICEGILKEFQVFPQKSGNSRDFRTFSFEFPGFSEISQITIFGMKPYPRGSGAWKQPQRSISKAGLHRIPWFLWAGSLPDVDIPWPSQPSQPEHTHTPPLPPLLPATGPLAGGEKRFHRGPEETGRNRNV